MKQNMELRADSAINGIIRDYNVVISKELKNLFNYIDGNQEGLETRDLYRCTSRDKKEDVLEMYKTLMKKICDTLKQPEINLKYFEIGRLVCALDDLAFSEQEVNAKLRYAKNRKVKFCLKQYNLALQVEKAEWIKSLKLLD